MKKILVFVMMISSLLLASCKPDKCDFKNTLCADYAEVVAKYPSAEGQFREAQIVLTDSLHVANPKTVDIASVREVYQAEEDEVGFAVFRDKVPAEGVDTTYTKLGIWFGSANMNPSDVVVSLPDALRKIQASGLDVPQTVFVTMRLPLDGDAHPNPLYIFGSEHTHYVCVDVVTGDIVLLDELTESGEAVAEETEEE